MSHGVTQCSGCGTVVARCRCMGPHTISWAVCDRCKAGPPRLHGETLASVAITVMRIDSERPIVVRLGSGAPDLHLSVIQAKELEAALRRACSGGSQ